MTRAQAQDGEIEYDSAGFPGADRVVLVLRTGALATVDPDPAVTQEHDVRLVLVQLDAPELDDPPAYGGETRAATTLAAVGEIARAETGAQAFGVVAERTAGALGVALAAELVDRVDRLALVAVPAPGGPLERDLAEDVLRRVSAKTLVVAAAGDAGAGPDAAQWHHDRLPEGEIEVIAPDALSSGDGRLGLGDVWARVLSHVAPAPARR